MRVATPPSPAAAGAPSAPHPGAAAAARRPVVVADLAAGPRVGPAVPACVADAEQAGAGSARLPLGRLAGLAGSGAFAFWTSLTCFVC